MSASTNFSFTMYRSMLLVRPCLLEVFAILSLFSKWLISELFPAFVLPATHISGVPFSYSLGFFTSSTDARLPTLLSLLNFSTTLFTPTPPFPSLPSDSPSTPFSPRLGSLAPVMLCTPPDLSDPCPRGRREESSRRGAVASVEGGAAERSSSLHILALVRESMISCRNLLFWFATRTDSRDVLLSQMPNISPPLLSLVVLFTP
mmetsp:Transcript_42040/g.102617  ORF Transcript_42040/g.102617 Transcript_42040/m.102617 type:complete len:204 (-) Transcript_42040:2-613(-)